MLTTSSALCVNRHQSQLPLRFSSAQQQQHQQQQQRSLMRDGVCFQAHQTLSPARAGAAGAVIPRPADVTMSSWIPTTDDIPRYQHPFGASYCQPAGGASFWPPTSASSDVYHQQQYQYQQQQQQTHPPLYGSVVPMTRLRAPASTARRSTSGSSGTSGSAPTVGAVQPGAAVAGGRPSAVPVPRLPVSLGVWPPPSQSAPRSRGTTAANDSFTAVPCAAAAVEEAYASSVNIFTRAALSPCRKAGPVGEDTGMHQYPTNFSGLIRSNPPALPASFTQSAAFPPTPAAGKVKVVLNISSVEPDTNTCLAVDGNRKYVILRDPAPCLSAVPASYRQRFGPAGPKIFTFDEICTRNNSLSDLCSSSLSEVLHAVIGGSDGCVFAFGPSRIGKTYTMIGMDDSPHQLGVIPCAIAWLYRLIADQKESTGARFSVRVSAVEVTGQQEILRDLLGDFSSSSNVNGSSPGLYLRDDPVCGTHLENQSEVRAPTVDMAAHLLDAAIAARTVPATEDDTRHSHLFFTLNVYQYRVETSRQGQNSVAGGRSRLHLIDLGSCGKGRDSTVLSLSAVGTIITSLLSGQRQVPYRERKLTQLLRESLGSASCHACAIVHVSPAVSTYSDTAQVVQLASRMHETRLRRRSRLSSSSEESSCDGSSGASQHWYGRRRAGVKMGVRQGYRRMTHSDPECVSGSEQSCDTVIYLGSGAGRLPLSDREFTDSETGSSVTAVQFQRLDRASVPITSPNTPQRIGRYAGLSTTLEEDSASSHSGSHVSDKASLTSSSSRRSSRFPRTSASPRCPATIPEHPDEEQWVDGPQLNVSIAAATENTPKSANTTSRTPRTRHPPAVAATELWVDGPLEFRTPASQASPSGNNVSISGKQQSTLPSSPPVATTLDNTLKSDSAERKGPRTESRRLKPDSHIVDIHSRPSSKHSSPLPKQRSSRAQLPPPDGRVSAWVQSVQEAAFAAGSLTEELLEDNICSTDRLSSTYQTVEKKDVKACNENGELSNAINHDRSQKSTLSAADASNIKSVAYDQSVYEQQMDECLETGSGALASSDDDASVWDSAVPKEPCCITNRDRVRDGEADGQADKDNFVESSSCYQALVTADKAGDNKAISNINDELPKFVGRISCLPVREKTHLDGHSSRTSSPSDVPTKCHRSSSSPRRMTSTPKRSTTCSSGSRSSSTEKSRIHMRSVSLASSSGRATPDSCQDQLPNRLDTTNFADESCEVKDRRVHKTLAGKSYQQSKSSTSVNAATTRSVSVDKSILSSPRSASKERKSRLPMAKSATRTHRSATASPDSGVVTDHRLLSPEHRLLSPYHAVTRPRRAIGCSLSSDNSSLLSDPVAASKTSEVEVSSGYESMLRDDVEDVISVPSSAQETPSECSSELKMKSFQKKASSTRRGGPMSPCHQLARLAESSDIETLTKSRGVWMENNRRPCVESVERREDMDLRQIQQAEAQSALRRMQRVDELLERQQLLRDDLSRAKILLSVNPNNWSFDLPVAESDGDRTDPEFLQALETETAMLQRRVKACQSRIMIVTCFDSAV